MHTTHMSAYYTPKYEGAKLPRISIYQPAERIPQPSYWRVRETRCKKRKESILISCHTDEEDFRAGFKLSYSIFRFGPFSNRAGWGPWRA